MKNKCLYCYQALRRDMDFHENCSREMFGTPMPPKLKYSLNQMAELAKKVVERSVAVPGVQAKLSMSLIRETQETDNSRLTVVGALGGNFILKPPSGNFPEMPQNEHLTMRIAEAFGLPVVPSSLIRLHSGELCYITRRVDRSESGEKIHMLDMFQITEAFDKYKGSLEKVGRALDPYSENTLLDKIYLFELTLLCFLTGNNDMHLKNFSMIESASGWILAPAYELLNVSVILPEDDEELALSMGGKKKRMNNADFKNFGANLDLTEKQINGVFNRMIKHKSSALNWIDNSFLSDKMKRMYKENMQAKYSLLLLQ